MAPKGVYKGKDRRRSSVTKIRMSPFRLLVRPTREGFSCEFTGLGPHGEKLEVELEFPQWWGREFLDKLDVLFIKRKA